MMRGRAFAKDYGTLIVDGPFEGVSARAVVVIDADDRVVHAEPRPGDRRRAGLRRRSRRDLKVTRTVGYNAPAMDYAIEGFQIEKSFVEEAVVEEIFTRPFVARGSRVDALRGVDLHVKTGEIFGLLGPNGAGKTTLVKILSCLILPDRGRATIGGEDVRHENKVKAQIGLVHSDERSFYWRLAGPGQPPLLCPAVRRPQGADRVANRRAPPQGGSRRGRFAPVLRLLVGDEAAPGDRARAAPRPADPAHGRADAQPRPGGLARRCARSSATSSRGRDGKTILLATHNLREAEALCDRIAILVEGHRAAGSGRSPRYAGGGSTSANSGSRSEA